MVITRLEQLASELSPKATNGSLLSKWLGKPAAASPRSIYIYGEVGRGKSMLMDLFFANVELKEKRRIHFHAFMQDIHRRRAQTSAANVLQLIAGDIAREVKLLCLDEMQVTDIADAMILGRLFEALLAAGTVIVTTSNLAPDGLYKDGLNRNLFLPAIAMMKDRFEVDFAGQRPRLSPGAGSRAVKHFLSPLGPTLQRRTAAHLEGPDRDGTGRPPVDISVLGRTLHVPEAAHGCARFTFADLCEAPLGPADYLALAHEFQTVFVAGIPALKTGQRNEAKRFVLLIDTLYDERIAGWLRPQPEAAGRHLPRRRPQVRIFPHHVSRLKEMQSASWWGQKIVET